MNHYDFYKEAESGEEVCREDCLQQIRRFQRIVIWGAGNLGSVLGEKLIGCGLEIEAYWDMRHADIRECNAIPVREPFTDIGDKEKLLVIRCITNVFILPALHEKLSHEKISYMDGTCVYQALCCPVSIKDSDIRECYKRKECNVATCKRHNNVMYRIRDRQEKLFIHTLDVYLTQKCSLKCKYCYIYTNSYPVEKRIHFDTAQILQNIDAICDAASYIKRMVPFGGEPFLHPDVGIIVERMAGKENVGVIDLISNGIYSQPDETLKKLKHDNVKVNISNYNNALPEKLLRIREENIERLQNAGLNVVVHNETPQWRKPGVLTDNHCGSDKLLQRKASCENFCNIGTAERDSAETLVIKAGRLYACQHCDTVHQLGIVKSDEDSVDLSRRMTSIELAGEIKDLIRRDYYQACRFCNPSIEVVEIAGEQGMDDRYRVEK